MIPDPDYLTECLEAYWFAPPVALWRAIELRTVAGETFEAPLLDLGCGDGLVAQALFGSDNQVMAGVDPWAEQLGRAAETGTYRHLALARGHALPYADGSFATVFSNSVLEHIPDLVPVLIEVRRVLMPKGYFIFTVPSDCFRYFLDGYVQRRENGDVQGAEAYATSVDQLLDHHHYYNPADWRQLLATVGIEVLSTRYYIPQEVERVWDRMNLRYGIGKRFSLWRLLVSPRLRMLGYQERLRRTTVERFSQRWRPYYEMDVPENEKGGGLLIVAQRGSRWR